MSPLTSKTSRLGLALFALLAADLAHAASIGDPCNHLTDGVFNGSAGSTTDATEWGCPTVSKSFFPLVNAAGGAYLYADQGGPGDNTLYLMYDYTAAANAPASFFDVFFEVVPDGHAYLVRIQGNSLLAFERPIGSIAPLDPNGSFSLDPSSSGWAPLTQEDLALANFKGSVGFGTSQNNQTLHAMAEFQLSINRGAGAPGLYDPSPAFWSASVKPGGAIDPPISSGVFQLYPDGTTTVTPLLGPDGGPLMQGSAVPEPASLWLFALGLVWLGLARLTRPGMASA